MCQDLSSGTPEAKGRRADNFHAGQRKNLPKPELENGKTRKNHVFFRLQCRTTTKSKIDGAGPAELGKRRPLAPKPV